MKYFFLIAGLNAGGAERVVASLANKLAEKENEVLIVTYSKTKPFYKLEKSVNLINIELHLSDNKIIRNLCIPLVEFRRVLKVVRLLKTNKPDASISFCFTANVINIMSKYFFRQTTYIVSERNDPTKYKFIVKNICKILYSKADMIICQSKKVSKFYDSKNTVVLSNPLNMNSIPVFKKNIVREKRIVAVGRLVQQKNYKLLIDAFSIICRDFPDYILEIYGEGPLLLELNNYTLQLKIENKVRFMGLKTNVMHSINNASVFVLSSNFEGFPNVLLEAMASGIPVVTTDFPTGVARDIVEDGINGYVVQLNDSEAMAKRIMMIISNSLLQKKMSINNIKIINKYNEDTVCQKWEDSIKECIIGNK